MATTKFSVSAYTADGVTTDFLITWDYLDIDHIAVYVDGTPNYDPTSTFTFSLINSTTVRITDSLNQPIASGSEIEVRRETPILNRSVSFVDGSSLLAEDLNKNSDYLLYSMQEVLDTVEAAAQDGALAAQVATEALRDETIILKAETEAYRDTAITASNNAQSYLATVQADALAAENYMLAADSYATNASVSETNAAASEVAAAASEAASAASEAASAASEAAAAASETAAANSATAAATSETNAAASETAAQTAQAAAELALDTFTDQYLGAKATAPTVDNDGDPLQVGALYWNNVSDAMYVWNGAAWDTLPTSIGIADGATATQVTITDATTTIANDLNAGNATITGNFEVTGNVVGSLLGNPEFIAQDAGKNTLITTHSRGVEIAGDTSSAVIDPSSLSSLVNGGMLALRRFGANSPYLSFHKQNGDRVGYIQGVETAGQERLLIQSDITDVIDMTGMRIRNSGVKTFLGSISNGTDVATIDIIWSDFGIDPTVYQQIIIEGHNMGVTAAASAEFRFFFGGTLFSGANYRWASSRGIYDGTTATGGATGIYDDSWGRFANPNDSTSHWNYFALSIPNPGKNAYSQYATTAYQGWWSTSRGVDTSSRPRVEEYSGFVNNATSRTVCTGVRLDHTSAANWRNTDIKIYGIVN